MDNSSFHLSYRQAAPREAVRILRFGNRENPVEDRLQFAAFKTRFGMTMNERRDHADKNAPLHTACAPPMQPRSNSYRLSETCERSARSTGESHIGRSAKTVAPSFPATAAGIS